jgi:OOP family OmpA-OmpF porin
MMIRDFTKRRVSLLAIVVASSTLTLVSAPVLAQSNAQGRSSSGSIVTLEAPVVADYWVSITRQAGGVLVFDGYAPDAATKDELSALDGADVNWLKLGSGAPENYRAGVDYGLSVLQSLSEGRFALRGNAITITGVAGSAAAYEPLLAQFQQPLPDGLTLESATVSAPRADSYTWSAIKSADGAIRLTGFAPNPAAEARLVAAAGASAVEAMSFASGEPSNFIAVAETGLALLSRLQDGSVVLNGSSWVLTGTPRTEADRTAIEADFAGKRLAASGWSMALSNTAVAQAPEVVAPAETPSEPTPEAASVTVDPAYSFAATRAGGGAVIMSGQVPADATLRFFTVITKGDAAAVSVATGAPEDFVASAEAGLRALVQLDDGQLSFADGKWSLKGTAPTDQIKDAASALLAANGGTWDSAITVAAAAQPVAVATATPSPAAATPADIAACTAPLADFSARNAILFQSGAAVITADSTPALDELAGDLSACPDAIVHIEGHTDADGDDQANLALSVARAEAVVNALIERQVNPDRLYAVGYGESKPIGDNETAAGKRLNRRIVVTVIDKHF